VNTRRGRQLDALEARAKGLLNEMQRRLPSSEFDPDNPGSVTRFLTDGELWRLEVAAMEADATDSQASLMEAWEDAQRRALTRALNHVNIEAAQSQENASKRWVKVPRLNDANDLRLVDVVMDLIVPDLWHVNTSYPGFPGCALLSGDDASVQRMKQASDGPSGPVRLPTAAI
jgi:hypothetical protein